jgi:exopolyphosphatase/guanosine-5'-triphosphate,3'-diphosphate pyrophosphatase
LILAAIDIGSNAARLLISEVIKEADGSTSFKKLNLLRVPLRLGFDVFDHFEIGVEKVEMLEQTMLSYKHLMQAYKVTALKAFATSAMRDAKNSAEIIKMIAERTGIQIEIISGDKEADLVYENHIAENMDKEHSYLYVDVGGGSTEISFFSKGIAVFKKSFNIGTIRLLQNGVTEAQWDELRDTLKLATKGHQEVVGIGSGGNINKVFSMSKRKDGKPLPVALLKDYYRELSAVSLAERVKQYDMRPDRADVIVPALLIYLNTMRWAGAEEIYVPKIGLADGLIKNMWEEIKNKEN